MKLRRGFTLIELLVVISIISLLASITFTFVKQARDKAKAAKTQAEFVQFRNAFQLLYADTGRLPGGCLSQGDIFRFVPGLGSSKFGVSTAPISGPGISSCTWPNDIRVTWKGSYYQFRYETNGQAHDAWGSDIVYLTHPRPLAEFIGYPSCSADFRSRINSVGNWLISAGPNGRYFDDGCDDIIMPIKI